MGDLNGRISRLEEQSRAEAGREPSEAFAHLRAILDELAALRSSGAVHYRGGVRVEPEDIPRRVLGPGYTRDQLLGLAVSRAVEACNVPADLARRYLDLMRGMHERGGGDPDAVVEWERRGA